VLCWARESETMEEIEEQSRRKRKLRRRKVSEADLVSTILA
jgi:hypothetical protein